jgi:hypothetical protein
MKRIIISALLAGLACAAPESNGPAGGKGKAAFPAQGGPARTAKEIKRCREEEDFRIARGNPNRVPPPAKPVALRSKTKDLTEKENTAAARKWNFFSEDGNPEGCFVNSFTRNLNGTVTDSATGLLWEEMGTRDAVGYDSALAYVAGLNRTRFAGFTGWRIPTCDEWGSIMEWPTGSHPWHIDPSVFLSFKSGWAADSLVDKRRGQTYQWNMSAVSAGCSPFYRRYPPGKKDPEDLERHNVRAVRSLP